MAARKETEEIKALNEEIRYLKTKAYQLITTNKSLKSELYQANGKIKSLEYSRKQPKMYATVKQPKAPIKVEPKKE